MTVTVANSGPPPGTTLVGTTTVETNIDFNSAGMAEAFRTTSLAAGPLTALRVYLDNTSAATRVVVGIYANATTNRPGTLLTQATITAPVKNAWNTITVPTVQITLRHHVLGRHPRPDRLRRRALPRPLQRHRRRGDEQPDEPGHAARDVVPRHRLHGRADVDVRHLLAAGGGCPPGGAVSATGSTAMR